MNGFWTSCPDAVERADVNSGGILHHRSGSIDSCIHGISTKAGGNCATDNRTDFAEKSAS